MKPLSFPKISFEEWILVILFLTGFLLIPSPIGREFILVKHCIMAAGILLLSFHQVKQKRFSFSFDWISVVFAALVGLQFLSAIWAHHPTKVWKVSAAWLMLFLFYLNLRSIDLASFSKTLWKWMVFIVLSINIILIVWVLLQVSAGENGFSYSPEKASRASQFFFFNSNSTSSLFLILILLFFHFRGKTNQLFTYGIIGTTLFCMFLLNSKVPVFTFFIIGGIYFFSQTSVTQKWRITLTGGILLAATVIFIFIFSDTPQTFFNGLDPTRPFRLITGDERTLLWEKSFLLWAEHPLLGVGSGNWMMEYLHNGKGDFFSNNVFRHSHNLIIETFVELGIPGGILIILLLIIPLFSIFKPNPPSRPKTLYALLFSYVLLSSYYGAVYCFDGRFIVFQYLWVAMLAIWSSTLSPQTRKINLRWPILIVPILCLVWQCFIVQQTWTYNSYKISQRRFHFEQAETLYKKLYKPYLFEFMVNHHLPGIHGNNLAQGKQYEKAVRYLEKSVLKSPYEDENWYWLGVCYHQLGKFEKARTAYSKAVTLHPLKANYAYPLALVSFYIKDWEHFEQGINVYYNFLLPYIEKAYNHDIWFSNEVASKNYGNTACRLQDQFILLIDKRDSLFQSEASLE